MKYLTLILLLSFSILMTAQTSIQSSVNTDILTEDNPQDRIQVLNFGTFHMSFTSDANSTEFDENDKENQAEAHTIAKALSEFKPTVILVEYTPKHDSSLLVSYENYKNDPDVKYKNPSEVELLAYEIGRLSGTDRIYGIDHKMGYNYRIGSQIDNSIDSFSYKSFYKNPEKTFPFLAVDENDLTLKEKFVAMNSKRYLDFLITVNADMLTHAGTDGNYEGADEAAKYYQRNLRMYSNMNRIDLKPDDRVFVLMGASHTAFFRDFISRSPKYHMVDTMDYLK